MHRLLTAKRLYQSSIQSVSLQSTNSFRSGLEAHIKCSYCRNMILGRPNSEFLYLSRHQSTRAVSALRSHKKKSKYKSVKKYGEVLEVGEKALTEKVSISKLKASHLSKLASSSVTLGQLHQLTTKPSKFTSEVDSELLQSVRDKILNQSSSSKTSPREIVLEDDKCALIFTNHTLSNVENRFKTKQYIDMVKESYYNFRKATLYDQRLQDLRFAINEGLTQQFDLEKVSDMEPLPKGPHAVFREIFGENQLDSYDQELMSHITSLQMQGMSYPAIDEVLDDPTLGAELAEAKEEFDFEQIATTAKTLKIKKAKQALQQKKKAQRTARRARAEQHMQEDLRDLERRGKQQALQRLLAAHLQLLCSLDMLHEGRRVVDYYRQRALRSAEHPGVTDARVYHALLHGYAALGQYDNVTEIMSKMRSDGVAADPQTYAAVFECVERAGRGDPRALLQHHLHHMTEQGITLNDLLDKTKFVNTQRSYVLSAIRRLEPDFTPVYTPPSLDYDCPLLDALKLDKPENRQGLNTSPAEGLMSVEELKERGRKQLEIEIKGDIEVENIVVKENESEMVKLYRKKLEETEAEWREVIREAFVRNVGTLRAQSHASHAPVTLYPYLSVLPVDQFVELIMGEISKLVDGSETYSPTLKLLQRDLGAQVYHKYQIEQNRRNGVLEKLEEVYGKYCAWYNSRRLEDSGPEPPALNCRQAWQTILHHNRDGASLDIEECQWPMEMKQSVGKFLYNIIINDVKIDVNMFKPKAKVKKLPAVYKVHRPWGRIFRLELKPHPAVWRLWAGAARARLRLRAGLLPLAAPPAPWHRPQRGAYLLTHTPLIRLPFYVTKQWQRIEEAPPEHLYPAYDSLNQLGEVPWKINKPILDLQMQIFRSGGDKKLDIPPPGSSLDAAAFTPSAPGAGVGSSGVGGVSPGAGGDAASKAEAFKRRVALNRARADMHSLWCDMLYKLSLANHYRDSVFWLPHNMDFRGRAYACGPHVSALGADPARALLLFARPCPLGPRGLRWLKLHAINLTGTMKKHTVDERLAYADSIMHLIVDSAERPLDGQRWWTRSEEPWQTLACCMEIANAINTPNPEEYECGFPVHQDGSCNGLQHYAALGGDAAGAAAVNLAPAPRPQDVYSAVAALVEEMRSRDAAAGVAAAQQLEGFVRRKVIKQTVMTTVYGVTKFGARLQIAKQLKDIDEFPKDQVWSCSQYLTARTFDSLRSMFTSTKLIQDWFTDCAKVISGVCGASVEWVTPLGLPVVQPYYRRAQLSAAAAAAALDHHQRPCTMKQRNAFPPNFIHSLDSSHMMLTSLASQAAPLAFVSVHDCFWTHPHTVDLMNEICRKQFVALHSQPILEELSDFLANRYSYQDSECEDGAAGAPNKKRVNDLLRKVPKKGDFDLNSVLDSVYFFS